MEDRSVSVTGFPATCNDLKLRLFVEKHVGQTGIIENIDRNEDYVLFKFRRNEDLQKFLKSNLTEMLFGDETYKLTVIAVTGLSENKPTIERERGSNARNEQGDLEFRTRRKLHVSSIPQHLYHYSAFRYHFERYGQLQNCYIKDSKRFGFITYMRHEDACNAKNYGSNVGPGRRLNIQWASIEGQIHPLASNHEAKRHSAYGQRTFPGPLTRWNSVGDGLATTPFHSPQNSAVPRKRSQDLQTPKQEVLNEQFFKKTYYWSSLNELPSPPGTRCVLAQNFDTSVDMEIVRMHFESKKRSSGGFVENIVKMIDGLLIVFQDNKDCESCLKNENQEFESKKIHIFSKTIPSYYGKRFILEGVADNTSHDTLIMYLEQCSENETSPVSCIKQNSPGVYLVEYGDDFNIAEMDGLLQKIRNKPLGTRNFKVNRLLETDCLKATGVLDEDSTEAIRFIFQSKNRASGGPVTRIDRYQNNTALIYFTSFTVAERIYRRFKKPCVESLILHEHSIEIELYFHSLANLHKNAGKVSSTASNDMDEGEDPSPTAPCPKRPLRVFQMDPEIHENIFFFIRGNKKFVEKLKNNFAKLAKVELNHSKNVMTIKCSPEKDLGLDTQNGFNLECKNRFKDFSAAFTTCSRTFDETKLENARSLKIHSVLDRKRRTGNNDFSIRWIADKPIVHVTGLKDEVDKTIKNIEALINSACVDMEVTEEQYRILISCGIIEELQQKFQNVDIKCDKEKSSITLSGPDSDVSKLRITALQQLTKGFQKRKLTEIDASVVRYLSESMNFSKMKTTIHEKFTDNNVKATLELDEEEARLVVRSEDDFKKAVKVITDLINVRSIPTDKDFSDVVKSKAWKGFQQNLKINGMCGLYIKTNQCIVLVSFASELLSLEQTVKDFLDENSGRKEFFHASYGVARYIVETSKEFSSDSCKRKKIKCGLTATNGGGIFIEGQKKDCLNAGDNMGHLILKVKERKYTLHDPGIKEYYESNEGKEFLESNERLNNCIILASTPKCKEWETQEFRYGNRQPQPSQIQSQSTPQAQLYTSIKLPKTNVTLQVWKTNIVQHKCDVIINASNPEFKLLSGGVSGEIKKFDIRNQNVIQDEMSRLVRENHGDFFAGYAAITTAGNLPACKRIVHAVGPRWNKPTERTDPNLILKACTFKSLQETERAGMTSIAIPALSCGVFGGKVKICIPLILQAVENYFEEEKTSKITTVDFVELSNQEVLDEFKKCVEKHKYVAQTPKPTAAPQSSFHNFLSQQNSTSGLSVKLVLGDISTQTADVIVNVTSPQGIHGSAISKALMQRAGAGVQLEFSLLLPLIVGNVYETNAGNLSCSRIYHSIVTKYNPKNSETVIRSIVKRCLDTADKAGFRSISFPAIATGGFQHPPASVALWMRKEISRFNSNSLKDVVIVLHPSNQGIISVFNAEFSSPSSHGSTSSSSSMSYGPLNISVYQGDITQESSEAIVNSAGSNFDLSNAGALSQAILSKGGNTIQIEVSNSSGRNYRISSGGNLPCRVIIHIAISNNEKDITKKLLIALEEADRTGITSISIPALATGGLGLNSANVAQAMKEAFTDFAKTQVSNLKTISVVVFDLTQLNDFKVGILNNQQTVFSKIKDKLSVIFQKFISSSADVTFDLYFYSTDSGAIDKAINNVTKERKKVVSSQTIEDDAFDRITDLEMWNIMQICKDKKVSIADKSTRYYKQFAFEGLTHDVIKAHEAVNKVLTEFCAAETSALYVTWQTLRNGNWDDCPIQANHILEKAFKARNGNNTNPTLNRIQIPEYSFREATIRKTTIDLSNLEGGQHGSNPPSVRRKVKEKGADNVIPSTWEDMKGHRFRKIKLSSTTQEYTTVKNKFIMAGGSQTILTIERIQNPDIYKLYITKKAEVTNKKLTSGNPVERELFHGTSDEDKILLHGFDRSYAGKNATAWGRGVYFATTASYSNAYAFADSNGHKRMFLANVVTGDYCLGNSAYVAPPQRPGTVKNDLYDSVVNNTAPPSIFVIFKDASAYPTYLITYT